MVELVNLSPYQEYDIRLRGKPSHDTEGQFYSPYQNLTVRTLPAGEDILTVPSHRPLCSSSSSSFLSHGGLPGGGVLTGEEREEGQALLETHRSRSDKRPGLQVLCQRQLDDCQLLSQHRTCLIRGGTFQIDNSEQGAILP